MCSINGIYCIANVPSVQTTEQGIELQKGLGHRGLDASGFCYYDGQHVHLPRKGVGQISHHISHDFAKRHPCIAMINHNRYSTAQDQGGSINAHPFWDKSKQGVVVLESNGNITNPQPLRQALEHYGYVIESQNDTELILKVIIHFMDNNQLSVDQAILKAMTVLNGTYSCLLMMRGRIIGFRSPEGNRFLEYAENDDHRFFSSETAALNRFQPKWIKSVEPGQIIELSANGFKVLAQCPPHNPLQLCVFEWIYLMSHNSKITYQPVQDMGFDMVSDFQVALGRKVYRRRCLGKNIGGGIVIPIMESGHFASYGFHLEQFLETNGCSTISPVMIKDKSISRTFIEKLDADRLTKLMIKMFYHMGTLRQSLEAVWVLIQRRHQNTNGAFPLIINVSVGDDSIVRGNTLKVIFKLLADKIQKEVPHLWQYIQLNLFVSAPPIDKSCHFGIATPTAEELAYNRFGGTEGVRGQSSLLSNLWYQERDDLDEVLGPSAKNMCTACFVGGKYIISIDNITPVSLS